MAPVPHPVRWLYNYLRNHKFPQAVYVSRPVPNGPFIVGFYPPITKPQKVLLSVALKQSKTNDDRTQVRIDPPEFRRRDHYKFTEEDIVGIFQPQFGSGSIEFSIVRSGEYEQTLARITLRRTENQSHLRDVFSDVEKSAKGIPNLGEPQVKLNNEAIEIFFPGRLEDDDWRNWVAKRFTHASRIHFENIQYN